jgi:hypothetical protein
MLGSSIPSPLAFVSVSAPDDVVAFGNCIVAVVAAGGCRVWVGDDAGVVGGSTRTAAEVARVGRSAAAAGVASYCRPNLLPTVV